MQHIMVLPGLSCSSQFFEFHPCFRVYQKLTPLLCQEAFYCTPVSVCPFIWWRTVDLSHFCTIKKLLWSLKEKKGRPQLVRVPWSNSMTGLNAPRCSGESTLLIFHFRYFHSPCKRGICNSSKYMVKMIKWWTWGPDNDFTITIQKVKH